jgi:hypothetical protein
MPNVQPMVKSQKNNSSADANVNDKITKAQHTYILTCTKELLTMSKYKTIRVLPLHVSIRLLAPQSTP